MLAQQRDKRAIGGRTATVRSLENEKSQDFSWPLLRSVEAGLKTRLLMR
jgi:hypothetical protein